MIRPLGYTVMFLQVYRVIFVSLSWVSLHIFREHFKHLQSERFPHPRSNNNYPGLAFSEVCTQHTWGPGPNLSQKEQGKTGGEGGTGRRKREEREEASPHVRILCVVLLAELLNQTLGLQHLHKHPCTLLSLMDTKTKSPSYSTSAEGRGPLYTAGDN